VPTTRTQNTIKIENKISRSITKTQYKYNNKEQIYYCPFWLLLFFVFELGFWFCYLLLLIGRLFFIFVLVVYPWACPLCLNLAVVSDVAVGGCSAFFIVVVVMCSLVLFRELVFVRDRDVCVLLLLFAVCVLGVRSL